MPSYQQESGVMKTAPLRKYQYTALLEIFLFNKSIPFIHSIFNIEIMNKLKLSNSFNLWIIF
jgi:hypothetical protein